MHPDTQNALDTVQALLDFKRAVDAEVEQAFPGLKAHFSLLVDGVNKTAGVEVKFDTQDEDQKLAVSEFVESNMERWGKDLTARGEGLTTPKLTVK
jgi:hypothetical protein